MDADRARSFSSLGKRQKVVIDPALKFVNRAGIWVATIFNSLRIIIKRAADICLLIGARRRVKYSIGTRL